MKALIIMIAAFGLACSTASKNQTAATNGKTSATKTATTAQKNETMEGKHHHHHHHKKAEAEAATAKAAGSVTCTKDKDERTIAVEKTDSGCSVNYTKYGKSSSVATGGASMTHCNDVSQKIQKHLEDAGYTCK